MHHPYSPGRIAQLLPNLARLHLRGAYQHPDDVGRRQRRLGPDAWVEERLIERADLTRALAALDWPERYALFATYIPNGMTSEQRSLVAGWDTKTVTKRCREGLDQMARFLGWQPDENRPPRPASSDVWRHPSLEAADD